MSADEKILAAPSTAGRTVAFIGGPAAGQARIIPEENDHVSDGDFIYRIWPFCMKGDSKTLYFAYDAQEHPIRMLYKMWEEYSIAAQIRGGDYGHIKRVGKDITSRS